MSGTGANNDVLGWGRVSDLLGDAAPVTSPMAQQLNRVTRYGDQSSHLVTARDVGASREGTEFITRSPTVDTGLASIAALATFTATSPFVIITNGNPSGGRSVILKKIKLRCTAAGTGGTNFSWATKVDNVANRYSSGGSGSANTNLSSILAGPYSTNPGAQFQSNALIYAGALVATADSPQARVLENGPLRSTINVVNDQITYSFGNTEDLMDTLAIATATATQRIVPHCSVTLPPQTTFLLHWYAASQSAAASYEVIINHIER